MELNPISNPLNIEAAIFKTSLLLVMITQEEEGNNEEKQQEYV